MEVNWAELIGVAAAVATLYAAQSKNMIPLRLAFIAANCLGLIYSLLHATYPTFILNLILLPVNAWRLRGMLNLIRSIDSAVNSDMNVNWLLPYTRPKNFKAGAIIMEREERAAEAFYIVSGEVEILETGEVLGQGSLLGEIGLFTRDGRRTMTVRCKTDVQTAAIDYAQFKQLYFQNPQFGFYLLYLVVARLQNSRKLFQPAMPC